MVQVSSPPRARPINCAIRCSLMKSPICIAGHPLLRIPARTTFACWPLCECETSHRPRGPVLKMPSENRRSNPMKSDLIFIDRQSGARSHLPDRITNPAADRDAPRRWNRQPSTSISRKHHPETYGGRSRPSAWHDPCVDFTGTRFSGRLFSSCLAARTTSRSSI
jgi:hypothetical protein